MSAKYITVGVARDSFAEPHETIRITFTGTTGFFVVDLNETEAIGTIYDDDPQT